MERTVSARCVSSPASTGGAETPFEQHVGAYWLAQLLGRAIPPVLRDSRRVLDGRHRCQSMRPIASYTGG